MTEILRQLYALYQAAHHCRSMQKIYPRFRCAANLKYMREAEGKLDELLAAFVRKELEAASTEGPETAG